MPPIPEDIIGEIRHRADIVAVIGQHVKLRKAGRSHKGLCPFHQEKSPSFSVNGDKGFFYCFGCQKKGDVFTFLMEYEGKSFHEAAEALAQLTGITLPERSPYDREKKSEKGEMLRVNSLAAGFFREQLLSPGGAAARTYLEGRGITTDLAAEFRLGYAPDEWRALGDYLAREHAPLPIVEALGLVAKQPKAGGTYDRFRHRLVCPVIVPGGDVVGFSARALEGGKSTGAGGEAPAKYFNSPESTVYKKSRLLYGLHRAQAGFRKKDRAILVEGNFDVVSLHQAGFDETVAPLGTALTEDQVELLGRYVDQVVLLYDGDAAGRAATLKSLRLLAAGGRKVRIALVPKGEDPDSLVRKGGAEALETVLARAQPAAEYFIHEVWARDGQAADQLAGSLHEAAELLRAVPTDTERDLLIGAFAAALRMEAPVLRQSLRKVLVPQRGTPRAGAVNPGRGLDGAALARSSLKDHDAAAPAPAALAELPPRLEMDILAILADHPSLVAQTEETRLLSLLTDSRLRDMYSAAREGRPLWSAAPADIDPRVAKHVLSGAYARVENPAHALEDTLVQLARSLKRARLDDLQAQAEVARRRGDRDLERKLVSEIVTTRKQVD